MFAKSEEQEKGNDSLNGLKLVPGMPVETFVQTGECMVMSYLVKALHNQITKAFREP
jgi:HlyD family secretion protein